MYVCMYVQIIDKEIRVTCKQIKYICMYVCMYVQIFMHNYVS